MSRQEDSLQYEPIRRLSREDALVAIAKGGIDGANAVYSIAFHDEESSFAFATCLTAIHSKDQAVRFAAVGALGEMAFVAGRSIDLEVAEESLKQLRNVHPELEGRIEDALDDLAMARKRKQNSNL